MMTASLHSARLTLRPVAHHDRDELFRIYGDPATNAYNPVGPYPDLDYTDTVLARWMGHWQEQGFGNWAIALRNAPDRVIGYGGLSLRSYAGVTVNNLGYRLDKALWGQGLASEFARCAVAHGFQQLGFDEITGVVHRDHLASQKVLQNCGMQFRREVNDIDDAPASLVFSVRREEWV